MRYNDCCDGTNVAEEVLSKYSAAWKEKGMTGENGLFISWYAPKQGTKKPATDIGFTAWLVLHKPRLVTADGSLFAHTLLYPCRATAFMNSWNPMVASEAFRTQSVGFLSHIEPDRLNVNPGPVAFALRDLIATENDLNPNCAATIARAREIAANTPTKPEPPFPRPMFGYILLAASELGDDATLRGLLNHVDRFFSPTWQDGGLYYPVNPRQADDDGNWTEVEPFTGNSAVAYARLNVRGGQRKMWEEPWTAEQVGMAPYVGGVGLDSGVDFLRGIWDEERKALVVTMRSYRSSQR
jgi:hypothetical protein